MSRSNPTMNAPHPCQRWFEWDGAKGVPKYYDPEKKESVPMPVDFTFILLDQLAVIKGWHDASESGITSNEIRDTTKEPFVVKSFADGVLVKGFYSNIRDRVYALGGNYTARCYMAFKNGNGELSLGCMQFKGAALNSWVEFAKAHRADIYSKAVRITGAKQGKKGQVTYFTPVFSIASVSEETNKQAVGLDVFLQDYFEEYFKRTATDQAQNRPPAEPEPEQEPSEPPMPPKSDDDVPF